jgi:DNA polymerase I-like protein with 3'-5' exonuclease and polymerase domains
VVKKYFNGGQVTTFFDRVIESDEHHALNYILQSTAADLFFKQMIKVWKMLEGRESRIAFCMHDSLVIDYCEKDSDVLKELKQTFSNTDLGSFVVNVSAGKNYGK